ncbi:uncharacterized protein LOC123272400 isoform X1 [Cotesia glomerata]|uniref:E3 ubiquitin-protein ligase APD1-4 middle domain-containing protein n=2 Tax=Cotesia glomerata TaxID=32391 RepID=A0AAV7J3S4_COTGL|nr:uncharacterized protein LOC123272400 isoform X1 [Cotesia glomerata]XP_044595071.1 uncharacterized protein LOC123272400 isoform X1 [Cotesia glomerata]XP_044595072.1 uncharacterized protein LOC123272400 isoform X1 [Cotesia glomerata]XP_044595073.1 uncharacterized protein LOC123272400 isoform X1 [Cotesia glomerata]XP_044595074.1 uncharacterized protein LOC123272400 isoform X1 [Cotesia glomerata]KAH0563860.1 hypothetical protein KQX54_007520 [Cotesia glomerata]
MHGAKRVIIFCLLTTVLPILLIIVPLYLRHNLYANVAYLVNESDVLEISDGISTIFCSAHTLEMNGTFNAFQMSHRPEITTSRKHLRLKKSMNLPDDTLEYWGFYLLRGASVGLSVCSRFPGASILVVKGEKTLRTCGMLDHNKNKARTTGIFLPEADDQVKITFESDAREIESEELATYTLSSTSSSSLPKLPPNITNKYIQNILKARMESNPTRKLRHTRKRLKKQPKEQNNKTKMKVNNKQNHQKTSKLSQDLNYFDSNTASEENDGLKIISSHHHYRVKRNQEPVKPPALLDQGIQHGGNALRNLTDDEDSSVSSFEEGLLNCYGGQVLLQQEFEPSDLCINVSYLETAKHMQSKHSVMEDGYYYYIFYSDNDFVFNDIHAVFDIYKPTFQYEDFVHRCVNKTTCTFPLTVLSSDRVIVEMPTKDGIDRQEDDISLLISVCHPRMGMYIIFPIAVLFSILSCAFL